MRTEQIYLQQPYEKTVSAKIIDAVQDGTEIKLILDKTVFYPMGGGQPTDQGILNIDGQNVEVYQVQIQEGEIYHFINANLKPEDLIGREVQGEINWERRYKNMKLHSAGHIIDFAIYLLGLSPDTLSPQKADHGKKPYIIYKGQTADFKENLQAKVNELIKNSLEFSWEMTDLESLKQNAIYLQPNLPTNKPLRMLSLKGVGSVADGGTIVKNTNEVENITITDINISNGETTVNYSISSGVEQVERKLEKKVDININNESLKNIVAELDSKLASSKTEEELTNLWRHYLGKDGVLKDAMSKITQIDPSERKQYGSEVNIVKVQIDEKINSAKEALLSEKNQSYLQNEQTKLDYKVPKIGHIHPLTETINELNQIFIKLGYSIMDGPEIETDEYCFQRLNLPLDHPARDLQDSIFIEEPNILLRTQTSSIEARLLENYKPPYKVVMPGRVYRNEKVNRSNHFTFHQYQLVVVQEKVSLAELISTIEHLFKEYLGEDVVTRYRNKYYPEVEPGVGPDMQCFNCHGTGCPLCKGRGWLEMGGAGIIHPKVLQMAGIDTNKWQGYAFGLGLDRWAMAKHNIKDIRTLLGGNLAYKPQVA